MEDLLANLGSISWWIGVVVVGITTSIVGAYLKPRFDSLFGLVSHGWATRTEARRLAFLEAVEEVRENEEKRAELRFETLRSLIVGQTFTIVSVLFVVLASALAAKEEEVGSSLAALLGLLSFTYGTWKFVGDRNYAVLLESMKGPRGEGSHS